MPERVTPEERLVSLAIEKARKAAEVLRQREPTQVKEVEHEAEEVKLKRPKAQADKTKIKTQSEETHSGYGLAGQQIKKQKSKRLKDIRYYDRETGREKLHIGKIHTKLIKNLEAFQKYQKRIIDDMDTSYVDADRVDVSLLLEYAESIASMLQQYENLPSR